MDGSMFWSLRAKVAMKQKRPTLHMKASAKSGAVGDGPFQASPRTLQWTTSMRLWPRSDLWGSAPTKDSTNVKKTRTGELLINHGKTSLAYDRKLAAAMIGPGHTGSDYETGDNFTRRLTTLHWIPEEHLHQADSYDVGQTARQ
eukprot:scaffold21444_cov30-Prasinocladus_malaysianus.AAC.1